MIPVKIGWIMESSQVGIGHVNWDGKNNNIFCSKFICYICTATKYIIVHTILYSGIKGQST